MVSQCFFCPCHGSSTLSEPSQGPLVPAADGDSPAQLHLVLPSCFCPFPSVSGTALSSADLCCSYNLTVNSRQDQICREITTFCRKLVFHYKAINHWNVGEITALAVQAVCASGLSFLKCKIMQVVFNISLPCLLWLCHTYARAPKIDGKAI